MSTVVSTLIDNILKSSTATQIKGYLGLTKGDVNLGNVDNTSDVDKPVSTAQQAALDEKASSSHTHAESEITGLSESLDGKEPSLTPATQEEMEQGSEVALRSMSPLRVKQAIEKIVDDFGDLYLGSKTAPPTVDNDGDTLRDGSMYWDTTTNTLHFYDLGNTQWVDPVEEATNQANQAEIWSMAANETAIPNGGIVEEKLASALQIRLSEIERKSLGALLLSPNLVNLNDPDYTEDVFVNWTNGALTSNVDYDATGYILVKPNTDYYVSTMRHYAFYDVDKQFISGATTTTSVVTSPANAFYVRLSVYTAYINKNTFYAIEGDVALAEFSAFGGSVDASLIAGLGSSALAPGAVLPLKTSFLSLGKNLFDKDSAEILENMFMGSDGAPLASSTYFISGFIEVEAGQTYTCAGSSQNMRFYTAFDSEKNVVQSEGTNSPTSTITVPASGVKYYRFTGHNTNRNSYQFEKSNSATGFEAYGYRFSSDIIFEEAELSTWSGKRFTSYGDSVTAQNTWQGYVSTEFGLVHTVLGVGGRQIAGTSGMNTQVNVDTIALDCELLTVMGGVNDWAQSRSLGAVDSTDTETFYGALNVMTDRLTTRLPNCRIVFMTPSYSEFIDGNWETRGGWTSGVLNAQGFSTRDYAEAVRVAAKNWGIPVVDVSAEEGVNSVNIDAYRSDDGNHIHPNDAGGRRIAEILIGRLSIIKPTN